MTNEDETFSFQEALSELHLEEEELKKLVSEGEIRAFRDGDDMRLRREDIANLRAEIDGEIVFDEDDFAEAGMATEEITEADTLIDDIEDIEEVIEEQAEESTPEVAAVPEPVEEDPESMGLRVAMMATAVLLFLALPVFISLATGNIGGVARSISGLFYPEMK